MSDPIYQLVRDFHKRATSDTVVTRHYDNITYTKDDYQWFMSHHKLGRDLELDLTEFLDLKTGLIFYVYDTINNGKKVINKLDNKLLLLIMGCVQEKLPEM